MRCLGLDIGDKRIGVALSDPDEIIASPLTTITRNGEEKDSGAILDLVNEHKVGVIIVGLPYSLNGSIGSQAAKVMDFIDHLSQNTDIIIETRDERLSTVAADRLLREAGKKKDKVRLQRDAAAAAFILQGYLDSRKFYDYD